MPLYLIILLSILSYLIVGFLITRILIKIELFRKDDEVLHFVVLGWALIFPLFVWALVESLYRLLIDDGDRYEKIFDERD